MIQTPWAKARRLREMNRDLFGAGVRQEVRLTRARMERDLLRKALGDLLAVAEGDEKDVPTGMVVIADARFAYDVTAPVPTNTEEARRGQ